MKKRVFAVILGSVMAVSLMACGTKENETKDGTKTYTVGISQFAEHASLDNCREGFIEGLKEAGFEEGKNLTIKEENAAADQGTAKQISDGFVSDDVDLICGIATPSAQAAYNSAMNTEIPVIYTAVTDPKAAKLANDDGAPVGEVTGTSDELPIKEQLEMIREMLPDAEKIGILYTTSEVNSVSAIEKYEELAGDYGFTIVKKGVTQTADISLATEEILSEVDCLTNLTDNTVVNSLATILDKANEKKIPVFGSEIEQVKLGCLAAEGLDYVALGKQTGKMAAEILKGEKTASEMNYETISEPGLYINTKAAEELSISQPSLSHAVSSLEKEIGTKLFEKQGRGVVLTKYGKIFKEYVDEAIHSLDTGVKKVQSMTGQTEGVVELAYIYTLGSGFVPRLVGDFLRTHEELKVKFRFTVGNTSEIIQGLKEDRFDIGFCSMAEREGEIGFTPVGREKLVVVVPKGHPLSYERAVDLEQAATYPQIFYTPNSGLRPVVDRMFEQAKLNPKIAYEIEEDGSMAGLVAENFGIAIMPEIPILSQLDVDVVPLRNQDQQRYIYMAQGKEKYHPPLVQKFAEYVKRRGM